MLIGHQHPGGAANRSQSQKPLAPCSETVPAVGSPNCFVRARRLISNPPSSTTRQHSTTTTLVKLGWLPTAMTTLQGRCDSKVWSGRKCHRCPPWTCYGIFPRLSATTLINSSIFVRGRCVTWSICVISSHSDSVKLISMTCRQNMLMLRPRCDPTTVLKQWNKIKRAAHEGLPDVPSFFLFF